MIIELNKEQYRLLAELVYLGNDIINGNREKPIKKYEEIEQLIYSKAEEGGLGMEIDFDEDDKMYYPNAFFEDRLLKLQKDYGNDVFWDELVFRLAERDVQMEVGFGWLTMDDEEKMEKIRKREDEYHKEFSKHGLDRVTIL